MQWDTFKTLPTGPSLAWLNFVQANNRTYHSSLENFEVLSLLYLTKSDIIGEFTLRVSFND
jgi:hypothetical protein